MWTRSMATQENIFKHTAINICHLLAHCVRSRSRRINSKYIWLTKSGQSRQSVSSIAQCAVTGSIQSWSPHPRASHQLSGLAQLTVLCGVYQPQPWLWFPITLSSPPTTIITIFTIHYRSFTQLPPPRTLRLECLPTLLGSAWQCCGSGCKNNCSFIELQRNMIALDCTAHS